MRIYTPYMWNSFVAFLESFILYVTETRSIVPPIWKSTNACINVNFNQLGLIIVFLLSYGLTFYCSIDSFQLGRHPGFRWLKWKKKNTEEITCTYRLHLHIKLTAQPAWVKLERKLPKHVNCLSFKTLGEMKQKKKESRGALA